MWCCYLNCGQKKTAVISTGMAASLIFVPLLREGRHEVRESLCLPFQSNDTSALFH